jgi:tetratricopeptide (TPR) repeat protein
MGDLQTGQILGYRQLQRSKNHVRSIFFMVRNSNEKNGEPYRSVSKFLNHPFPIGGYLCTQMKKGLFLFAFLFALILSSCSGSKEGKTSILPTAADSNLVYSKIHPLYRLDTLLNKQGATASTLFQRAQKRLFYGDPIGALEDMKRLQKLDSNNAAYMLLLSDIYLKMAVKTSCSDANLFLLKAQKLDSLNPEILIKKAKNTFICNPDFKNHLVAFTLLNDALKKNAQLPEAYFWKGMIYLEETNYKLAISSFQTAIEVDPSYYSAYLQLGQLYGGAFKDTLQTDDAKKIAISYLSNAIQVDSFNDEALYARGLLYQNLQDWERAKIDYDRILKVYPTQVDALYNRAVCFFALKNWKGSEKDFTQILQFDSTYAPALKGRAMAFEEMGDLFQSARDYRKILLQYPNEPDVLQALGRMKSQN